jgi:hypothetical protein
VSYRSKLPPGQQAIAHLARVSQQTLYKYQSLWHPHHVQGEINEATGVSAAEIEENQPQPESQKALENKALHPLEEIMKGEALCADDSGSDLESFPPDRGVRGDELSFPQAEPAEAGPELPIPLAELDQRLRETVQTVGMECPAGD